MRIVYIINALYNSGGMEKIISDKANALADDYGYDVTIVTARQKGRSCFFPLSPAVRTVDIGCNYHLPAFRHRLAAVLEELKADVVVSLCGGEMRSLPDIHDGSVKVAEFHFSHDRYFYREGSGIIHDFIAGRKTRSLERSAARMDRFVVLTDADKSVWDRIVPGVCRIYNFVNIPEVRRSGATSRHCVSLGQFRSSKNHVEMIEAWSLVSAKHPDWTLDIYGRGHLEKKLSNLIVSLGLQGRVVLHKPVRNISEVLASSDIFLFTSLNEGMGICLIEAMSAGLPCVSYDCKCGPSEIITDSVDGYLVREHDIECFADRVCRLIESDELRNRMSVAALAAAGRFDREVIMREWDSFFRSLR